MTDPEIILEDIIRGFEFYSTSVSSEISIQEMGNNICPCDLDYQCLLYILKSLEWRLEQEKYDNTTELLYKKLILIIGTQSDITQVKFYYGIKDTSSTLTIEQILASSFITRNTGINPTITFPTNSLPKYYWFAELLTEPTKTKWQDTIVDLNFGNIGTSSDLFGAPVTVSTYRFYDTEYATQFSNPIQFKVI